jgi:two-component system, OmpR family, response regulator
MPQGGLMKDPSLRRILFVEDDPDIQIVAKMALEAIGGFLVLACGSGSEALSRLGEFGPDLVLLDVMMPGMDGPATMAALRDTPSGRDLPVVFMTSRVQAQEVAAYREMGAADVIAKPFDPMALSEQVRSVWDSLRARLDSARVGE